MRYFILWLLIAGKPTMLGLYSTMELCQSAKAIGRAQATHFSEKSFACIPAEHRP